MQFELNCIQTVKSLLICQTLSSRDLWFSKSASNSIVQALRDPRWKFAPIAIVFLLQFHFATTARILFLFAGGNLSQKTGVWPFALRLAEHGHDVTFISSHHKTPVAHPYITDIAPDVLIQATATEYDVNRFEKRKAGTEHEVWETYDPFALQVCELLLEAGQNDPELRQTLYGSKYDVVIINAVYGECGFLVATHLRIPYIQYCPTTIESWFHTSFGIPWPASWIPDMSAPLRPSPLSFLDRVRNFWTYATRTTRTETLSKGLEALHARYLPDSAGPSFMEMERNVSLVFVNTHVSTDFARPLPPWFVQIGGLPCWTPVGKLPASFQEFMDDAPDGVILIAFGSTIEFNKLSSEQLHLFFAMMRKFSPVRFIWRWTGEPPKGAPDNLLAADWLPQKEILSHPKLRAFMTHCGASSVTEAACYGVPLIAVPLFADQDLMAYRIQAQQLGVYLEVRDLSQETLDAAVNAVLTRPEYKKNMMARSAIIMDRPLSPVDTAVYWTEFVMRHEDMSAFKPMEILGQSPFVRQMFDVVLVLALVAISVPALVAYVLLRFHFNRCISN